MTINCTSSAQNVGYNNALFYAYIQEEHHIYSESIILRNECSYDIF